MGKGATRQARWLTEEEEEHQHVKNGAHMVQGGSCAPGAEGEEEQEDEKEAQGEQGGAHITHILPNSHEYRLHEAGGPPWSIGDLKVGENRGGCERMPHLEGLEGRVLVRGEGAGSFLGLLGLFVFLLLLLFDGFAASVGWRSLLLSSLFLEDVALASSRHDESGVFLLFFDDFGW